MSDITFEDQTGTTLTAKPGEVNGWVVTSSCCIAKSMSSTQMRLTSLDIHQWLVCRCRGSVTLRNLTNCSVYILDYSTSLIVSGCTDCQLFVGAVLLKQDPTSRLIIAGRALTIRTSSRKGSTRRSQC